MNDTKMDEEKYKMAKKRVEEIKGFLWTPLCLHRSERSINND